jgi:aldehyde:ferredoxin oxidoreductase
MAEIYGWAGKILRVDLTKGEVTDEPTLPKYQDVIGGTGIGYKVQWDEVPPEVDAFDPENRITFGVGPLTGSEAPGGSTRTLIVAKSPHVYEPFCPETSFATESSFGGRFGPELKYAGYDAVVIHGKSPDPVYLWIHDGVAEIKDAKHLWGLGPFQTTEKICEELGDSSVAVASIGPGGENLMRFAAILHRGRGDHGAGQGGFGAVMGSKKLKAIAVRAKEKGTGAINAAKKEEFYNVCVEANRLLACCSAMPGYSPHYKAGVDPLQTNLALQYTRYDVGSVLDAEQMAKYCVDRIGDCANRCGNVIEVPGIGRGTTWCMTQYYGFVGKMGAENFRFKFLCDEYGINTYEMWLLIPWLRKLYKEGLIDEESTGIALFKYPEKEFIETLLEGIAFRKGFGDTLAEGVARAFKKMGWFDRLSNEDVTEYMAIPELEGGPWSSYGGHGMCGHYDPRDYVVDGLLFAIHTRDPHDSTAHNNYTGLAFWSFLPMEYKEAIAEKIYGSKEAIHPDGKPRYCEAEAKAAVISQHRGHLLNVLTLCDWAWPCILSPYPDRNYMGDTSLESRLFSAMTGIKKSEQDLYKDGERIVNLARAVTIREMGTRNMRKEHDFLPDHYFLSRRGPWKTGVAPLDKGKFESLKGMYYKLRGWDENGLPTRSKLEELGLKDVADGLKQRGLLGK